MAKAKLLDKDGQPIVAKEVAKVERLPTVTQPESLLPALIRAASDPATSSDKLKALLDARDRLMREQAEVEFVSAYVAMQEELPTINKDGRIEMPARPGKASKDQLYSSYPNLSRIVKPILLKHKFACVMLPEPGPENSGILMRGELSLVCETEYGRIVHTKRCAIPAPLEVSGSKNPVQGVGSSLSYTKRYAKIALLDIISEAPEDKDDDGRRAGKRHKPDSAAADDFPGDAPPATVTAAQADKLIDAIEACGVGRAKFCAKYGIKAVADLPTGLFDDAVAACTEYAERAKK